MPAQPKMQALCSTDLAAMEAALDSINDWSDFAVKLEIQSMGAPLTSVADALGMAEAALPMNETCTFNDKPVQRSTTKRRKRRTPKQEIERLRVLEHNLARRLETLQLAAHNQTQQGHLASHKRNDAVSFWKAVATRQYEQRLASERENLRLKKIVKARIAHAKRVSKYVSAIPATQRRIELLPIALYSSHRVINQLSVRS
ncbi:hypothetical protein PHYPSEUDO_010145 [Phytophthora pseudosyringae]|uniref:Uncharacterized protein n=1 Tax=Phytophthora pseudosyringae TaxID=221518 RepID=A0A8T1VDW0_9STRA|nr:hypothetical protein PHYPSEUDO_010145 [Phytophthora pseudosyringae]